MSTYLSHDELNVLALKSSVVNLLTIILLHLGSLGALDSLALLGGGSGGEVGLDAAGVLGLAELVGRVGLSLRVQVLDLGLTKDAVKRGLEQADGREQSSLHPGVAGGGLVNLGVVDDKEDL